MPLQARSGSHLVGCRLRHEWSDSPFTYSITRYTWWLVSIASNNLTTPGCCNRCNILISLKTYFCFLASEISLLLYCLIATFSPEGL